MKGMRNMKKFITSVLVVCLIITIIAIPASAATFDYSDLKWSWDWSSVIEWLGDYGDGESHENPSTETDNSEIEEAEPVVTEYTIRYEANGGYWWSQYASPAISNIKSYTVEAGEVHKIISAPIRTLYTFQGWEAPDGSVYQPGDKITPTESMTLKAVWG